MLACQPTEGYALSVIGAFPGFTCRYYEVKMAELEPDHFHLVFLRLKYILPLPVYLNDMVFVHIYNSNIL
jgi:hypothetical protein